MYVTPELHSDEDGDAIAVDAFGQSHKVDLRAAKRHSILQPPLYVASANEYQRRGVNQVTIQSLLYLPRKRGYNSNLY